MPVLTQGAAKAEKAAEEARSQFAGRAEFLRIGDKKNPTFFRPLTEHDLWITANMHVMVPTIPKPSWYKGDKWMEKATFVCANDVMFRLRVPGAPDELIEPAAWEDPTDHYGHCWIEEKLGNLRDQWGKPFKAGPWIFAFCALRELVRDANNQPVGLRDVVEKWKDDKGIEHMVPAIRLMQQKWSNFYGALKASGYLTGTVLNRDFMATKDGTEIEVIALDPTPDHSPLAPTWQAYLDAMELRKLDLGASVVERSTKEYFRRFLDPSFVPPKRKDDGKEKPEDEESEQPAVSAGPEDEASKAAQQASIDSLRERLARNNKAPEGDPSS